MFYLLIVLPILNLIRNCHFHLCARNEIDCTHQYSTQPPNMLDCDPLGTSITLQCGIQPVTNTATFYWTQNVCEAGVSGTAILPGDTSDNYQVGTLHFPGIISINFSVSESTLGYCWCEISNAVGVSLRPSTITPVCPLMSISQKCDEQHVLSDLHHFQTECAEENSPTVISRPLLPTSCAMSPPSVSGSILIVNAWYSLSGNRIVLLNRDGTEKNRWLQWIYD